MTIRETTEATMVAAHKAGLKYWHDNRPHYATREKLESLARSCGWHGEDNVAWLAGFYGGKRRTIAEGLEGMTQAKWDSLTPGQREIMRSDAGLTKQLIGLEGWRVEVVSTMTGEKYRFIVGRSTGWVPCHIELRKRNSSGGISASRDYASVRKLYKVR